LIGYFFILLANSRRFFFATMGGITAGLICFGGGRTHILGFFFFGGIFALLYEGDEQTFSFN